ncbi:sortase family protein [Coriobacterium glomerans PW2]|uniref:Sortase family protein n=1 Tax=Coriobacterium glomerans (strain ATCC 49209 / DSM 20642 / JCM 10262 / PW2) TaxID=700015 RepID=F2N783_CORGP|nr:class C sortase [Coriobacterium glomerans]AEB06558.1 sortase family protein [Coriobacterium glomerans PW2]
MPRARKRGAQCPASKVSLVLSIVLFMLGAAFIFYPAASSIAARGESDAALSKMRRELVQGSAAQQTSVDGGVTYRSKSNDSTYLKLQRYNEAVRTGTSQQINDPFAFNGGELNDLGLPDGIIGSITIPRMSVTLPLYLGATDDHMNKGAGIIAGTSMPLGEKDSNTVVAAHRGALHGLLMFRNIESMQPGDQVVVETPWETIVYATVSTKIIDKADADALNIQSGRDMLTLFTCHPYGQNSQRYLVFCEKTDAKPKAADPGAIADAITGFLPPTASTASPMLVFEDWLRILGLALTVLCGLAILTSAWRLYRQSRERKHAARVRALTARNDAERCREGRDDRQ